MGFVEIGGSKAETPRQRWSNVLTFAVALVLFGFGVSLRQSALTATVPYTDIQAGITAFYPENWLLDTAPDYIFRVRDTTRQGYKTTIQISVQPASASTTERNIADRLSNARARTFTGYNVLAVEPYELRDGIEAQAVSYSYVSQEASPFLQGIPGVVVGIDILTITRGQALIMTFRAEASIYDQEFARFEQFLDTLEF
jgi:hypothetical protein